MAEALTAPAAAEDDRLLTGWGRTTTSRCGVVAVRTSADIAAEVARASGRGVVARGLGRSYGDAAQNAGGRVLDTTRLDRIGQPTSDGRIRVESGVTLADLTRATLPRGWFVAVTPGTQHVTIGGAIACDVHGKNHHRDGTFTAHVESIRLVSGDGHERLTHPRDEPFTATAGGLGLTGVITEATLRLTPVATTLIRVDTQRASDFDDLLARMTTNDDAYRYSVAWVDLVASGSRFGRGVLERGDHAAAAELPADRRAAPLTPRPQRAVTARLSAPPGAFSRRGIRLFNEAWYRHAPRDEQRLVELAAFFYPLDRLADWNRLYGAGGFVQHQFVVPFGAADTLRRIAARLAAARCPVALAVVKRFGAGAGLMSFPVAGWTLAFDVPARWGGLQALLDSIDDDVAEAGGRVYLAKDARLRRTHLEAMYPELGRWREARDRLDPQRVFRSDLDRRLGLVA
jgi:decaprenylphospho-beta-D-ribofuranose 2-oxidase